MVLSMTAFARAASDTPGGALVWALRTVNHRYLETSLRLPEELRVIDVSVRELIARRLERGKLDATLRLQPKEAAATQSLNALAAKQLLAMTDEIQAVMPGLAPL